MFQSKGNKGGGTKRLTDKELAIRRTIRDIKKSATSRGKKVEINDNQIRELLLQPCYYCGGVSQRVAGEYNGIDRLDNELGYTLDNIVACCGTCNRMKFQMNEYEFKNHIMKIYWNKVREL